MAVRSTSALRAIWGPACQTARFVTIPFGKDGARITVDKRCVEAFNALAAVMEKHGYRITPPDVGAYNCRQITGGTNYSLHAYGIAVDVNWLNNPYGPVLHTDMPLPMVREISPGIVTNSGAQVFRWGGDYSGNKDAMHFEIVASPAELATGIKPVTTTLTDEQKLYYWLWAGKEAAKKPRLEIGSEKNPKNIPYIKQAQKAVGLKETGTFGAGLFVRIKTLQKFFGFKPGAGYGVINKKTWQYLIYNTFTKGRR